jgi:predicted nuclease of predicted toxin-antitoxin system
VRFKLDENLGTRGADLLRAAQHDVATVADPRLCAANDRELIGVCRTEARCLVTLNLDFANPLLFKPADYAGIAVLRLRSKPSPKDLTSAIQNLIAHASTADVTGRLWIVEPERVREYEPERET